MYWHVDRQQILERSYVCGFCSKSVSSSLGIAVRNHQGGQQVSGLYVCPHYHGPSFFTCQNAQIPAPAIGNPVANVPPELTALYEEARRCTTTACYTAAVLLCRKMLMNIAVQKGVAEGLKFIEYVDYLSAEGYTPPDGKHWVDHIRKKGNEATHEIKLMSETDARELLTFIEMLLTFIYYFPSMVPKPPAATTPTKTT
ncbi:MAG TPA: DUF4145 domain-containing protein [Verrucomicrobiae bacterium]|nr:DUF4145 domain-containing protein [Verrucomicrobiae bacterium]